MATASATPAVKRATRFSLTEREQQGYSLARAILVAAQAQDGREEQCFELDVSEELAKQARGESHGGIFIPWSILRDQAWTRQDRGSLIRWTSPSPKQHKTYFRPAYAPGISIFFI